VVSSGCFIPAEYTCVQWAGACIQPRGNVNVVMECKILAPCGTENLIQPIVSHLTKLPVHILIYIQPLFLFQKVSSNHKLYKSSDVFKCFDRKKGL
jgi:hypothetical protein